MPDVQTYIASNADRYVAELCELLHIASVSGDSKFRPEVARAAEWVRGKMADAGLKAEIIPTPGHPVVYGEWLGAPGAPTVMIYGHYDVQPPDPLDLWTTPPFEPTIRDGHVYARGASDDKGQVFTHVKSVEAWMKARGKLPVNVKFVIEGEEEVGSRNLEDFLHANKERLKSDVAVVSDTSQYAPGMPAITYGLRGILSVEVFLTGPNRDLHSGVFGGSVANPVNALAALIGSLHDENGRVQIAGFYDDVVLLTDAERRQLAALPFKESDYLAKLGVAAAWGEAGFTTLERRWARPTCDVNGILGGYAGEGPKTIVPSKASAKITCRLVPNQDPDKLTAALKQHFESRLRPGIQMMFSPHHGATPLVFAPDSPWMAAARAAIDKGFGTPPVMIREGGSIPVVATFRDVLGVDTLLLGWGQDTDNLHSPNERFSLSDFQRGIAASAALWEELGKRT
jgi:acetylornithine deacetylase/succinyl-diaminopimelate desuccinylase-like protein